MMGERERTPIRAGGHTVAGIGTIAGPLALLFGWLVLLQLASQGPTAGWFFEHMLLLSGVALLLPALLGMRPLPHASEAREGAIALGLGIVGVLSLASQYAIDLVVSQLASDHAELTALLDRIQAMPGVAIIVYSGGPVGLYVGLAMLVLGLYKSHRVPLWAAAGVVLGCIAVGVGRIVGSGMIVLLGHVLICIGCVPIGWRMLTRQMSTVRSSEIAAS
jgi:hypothetical protein